MQTNCANIRSYPRACRCGQEVRSRRTENGYVLQVGTHRRSDYRGNKGSYARHPLLSLAFRDIRRIAHPKIDIRSRLQCHRSLHAGITLRSSCRECDTAPTAHYGYGLIGLRAVVSRALAYTDVVQVGNIGVCLGDTEVNGGKGYRRIYIE